MDQEIERALADLRKKAKGAKVAAETQMLQVAGVALAIGAAFGYFFGYSLLDRRIQDCANEAQPVYSTLHPSSTALEEMAFAECLLPKRFYRPAGSEQMIHSPGSTI